MRVPKEVLGHQNKFEILLKASTILEARSKSNTLPDIIESNWRRFINKASTKYDDFEVRHYDYGEFVFKISKPGNVVGSRAEYYKHVDALGRTQQVYKVTFDPKCNIVHRKDKLK